MDKLVYRPFEAQAALGIKNTKFWDLVKSRQIEARKIGSATVIPAASLHDFINNLPKSGLKIRKISRVSITKSANSLNV